MNDIGDITPPHEPISVARDMVKEAPGCKAAVAVLVREDGSIWQDDCGHERAYVLWALERARQRLMSIDEE